MTLAVGVVAGVILLAALLAPVLLVLLARAGRPSQAVTERPAPTTDATTEGGQ